MAIKNTLLGGTDFVAGTKAQAVDMNDTFNAAVFGICPIGTVLPWLKDFNNTPALPASWVECSGQVLSDGDSVYDGETIPDLNSSIGNGNKGRFLRGHTESGLTEDSQNLAHTHSYTAYNADGDNTTATGARKSPTGATTGSTGDTEARPFNYSVVFIMRIK